VYTALSCGIGTIPGKIVGWSKGGRLVITELLGGFSSGLSARWWGVGLDPGGFEGGLDGGGVLSCVAVCKLGEGWGVLVRILDDDGSSQRRVSWEYESLRVLRASSPPGRVGS